MTKSATTDSLDPNLRTSTRFISEKLATLKSERAQFSIRQECAKIRTLSPALVSLVIKGKRNVSLDRVADWAQLLKLTSSEKQSLRSLVEFENLGTQFQLPAITHKESLKVRSPRTEVSDSILNQSLNIYVKDAFQLKSVQKNPKLLYKKLSFLANETAINKSIQFLLKEGYLRRTIDGKIVIDQPLSVKEPKDAHLLVRRFHKKALKLALLGLDVVPTHRRIANTLIVPLDEKSYFELKDMIRDFADRLKEFAETKALEGNDLYQLTLNLCPTGDI